MLISGVRKNQKRMLECLELIVRGCVDKNIEYCRMKVTNAITSMCSCSVWHFINVHCKRLLIIVRLPEQPDMSWRPYLLLPCFFATQTAMFQTARRPHSEVYQRLDSRSGTKNSLRHFTHYFPDFCKGSKDIFASIFDLRLWGTSGFEKKQHI